MTWKIQAISGDLTGQEISIERDMLVGRHQQADIVLQESDVSRKHAAFVLKDQALWLQDLNSSNGTFINDVRLTGESLLKEGDIVQFASVKFSLLAPAKAVQIPADIEQSVEALQTEEITPVQQPSEAVAVSETAAQEPVVKTAAQQMNDQGMPELKERDGSVQLTRDGMPTNVGVPKPAPIPEGIDITAAPKNEACDVEIPAACVEQEREAQKNASVGLISVIVLIILAIIAWVLFK
ncbi:MULTISPECIES: FHA domain-containing protein [unclassified Acinetobacter]|uniref:FHA domain-containing protein n=1 Tax=unclassified Acinetobacter TaxID=196816 RepID=UPI0015D0FC47|nr:MULTISPECIES: FHA domain-containing protein [unclassified Acinetobacter]